ncbi:cytochrome P450 4V2-like isoform X1 [Anoplophora glabripennis]|uniref:cytochrome P450 4V2-like isoform X1 n=1 Tax=Anoplophora glabripennis TaxID=217634 RepID=UPI000C764477|nr:cytochrome P450 4V2-like isoform X1 [Anoplophora glabripennis]
MYIALVCAVIVVFLLTCHFKKDSQIATYLPGPKPVLLFGNVLDFLTSTTKFLTKLVEYVETYGEIVRIHLSFSRDFVLVTDYKLTERVLSSTKMLDKSFLYDSFDNWLGTGLLTSTGAKWRSRRKMITPSFHFTILTQFIKTFESVGDNFIAKLEKLVGKPSVDIYPWVSLCTLDIICEAVMGTSVNALDHGDSEYVHSVKTMCAIVMDRVFTPFHKSLYPLTPNYFREKKALKVLHSHTDKVIDKKINSKSAESVSDSEDFGGKRKVAFLDLLLESTIDGKPLTRADLREEVDTFMFEGHDTTASAITFALYTLATNPDVQQKVVEEQKTIFGSNQKAYVTASDLQNMKYLELVIKETLRLYPSVPIIGRKLNEDVKWDDITLPKGQAITLFIFGIHRSPKYFPDPLKFIPERFENYEGKEPFSYIPFSAGPRNCIGQKFAMMELKTTLSKVIRNFELRPSTPEHVLLLAPETILLSKNGVRISINRRKWE